MRLSRRGIFPAIAGSVLAGSATADPSDDDDDPPMPLKLVVGVSAKVSGMDSGKGGPNTARVEAKTKRGL